MKITSFEECKRRVSQLSTSLSEVVEFLDFADNTLTAVNVLKGERNGQPARKIDSTQPQTALPKMPEALTDRVMHIFQTAEKPLRPKEAAELYEARGWPRSDNKRTFYIAILGAMRYLAAKKHTLERTETGHYKLKSTI